METQRYKEVITPNKAVELLKDNDQKLAQYGKTQRTINPAIVQSHKTQMLHGDWKYGIGSISLAPNGAILNGKHTLTAISESGVSVTMDVWKNCDPENIIYYDNAVSGRSPKDVLEIDGHDDAALKAKIVPKIVAYNEGVLANYRVKAIPMGQIRQTLQEEEADIEAAVLFAKDAEYRAPTVGLMHYAYNRAGLLDKVLPFLSSFKDGAELKGGSLGLRFRSYVLGQGRNLREKKLNAVFFRTLNAIVEGKDVGNFGHVKNTELRPVEIGIHSAKKQKKARKAV
jgi:hypothetical protein